MEPHRFHHLCVAHGSWLLYVPLTAAHHIKLPPGNIEGAALIGPCAGLGDTAQDCCSLPLGALGCWCSNGAGTLLLAAAASILLHKQHSMSAVFFSTGQTTWLRTVGLRADQGCPVEALYLA